MKCKKFIAMGMAAVTALSLGIPALAEDTVITGMYNEIKIDVEIPATGTAVINPYGMPVKAKYVPETGEAEDLGALTTAGKIATQPLIGISTCEVALDVGATVTGTPKGDLVLSNKSISAAKTKSAVVYLECKQDTTLTKTAVSSTASDKPISGIKGADAVTAFNAWDASTYNFGTDDAAAKANSDKVLVTETGSTKLGLCTLAAAKDDGAGNMEPQTGSFLLARLGGDVVQSPTDAWTAKDGVVVNVAFTFTPAAPKAGGEITLSEASVAAGPVAVVAAPEGVTFAADATYEWTITDAGTTAADRISQAKNGAITSTGTLATGTLKLTCTVTSDGIKYVTPETSVVLTA